ncbi:class I SAM-dependent methyltransferase [Aquimonas voraii]|uniref:16S rRNA m(2)G 1207 methyltransferase n=1 Tax=Aquimonas voraii TaxID=265719 RepID=A0A1G6ZZN2_9GAMM|nr:class I SAM-dependent methyltransferase [Aquimonas voraii]SDE08019.1 16S rRNA m(2)G 1207 methyltransferase [Aquimonas voraii]
MADVDADLAALGWALRTLPLPAGPALWIGARPGLDVPGGFRIVALQDFAPWCAALTRAGLACRSATEGDGVHVPAPGEAQSLVLLSPARQREAARAEAARALAALADDGLLLASIANDAGAKAFESDLRRLCPVLEVHSKHKCRLLLARASDREFAQIAAWRDLDAARPLQTEGFVAMPLLGAPGLFAVNRIDAGSALLIEHLPTTLAGAVADLGSGLGVLSAAALERCPGLTSVDLFEANARAVALSRHNLRDARVPVHVHGCDVTLGVAGQYDAILCNPPFHEGARGLPAIGQAFLRAAADALKPKGEAWIVANAHLPYEAVLTERFDRVDRVAEARGFKLLRTCDPRPRR